MGESTNTISGLRAKIEQVLRLIVLSLVASTAMHGQQQSKPIVAIVNGSEITQENLQSQFELQQQIYDIKVNVLQHLISTKLLELEAKKSGLGVEELLNNEVDAKIGPPSEGEIHGFYLAQRDRYQGSFEGVYDAIAQDVRNAEIQQARKEFGEKLRATAKIAILVEAPRVSVEVKDAPRRGAERPGAVTVIEFGDYQCPFCRGVQATLHQVREKYGDKVSFVFKDFPLREIHPQAQDAAEAASCAREQGQFWEFHDAMFSAPNLTPDALEGLARKLDLDVAQFGQCLATHKYAAQIDADMAQGTQMGMSGTPAFNINGVVLTGAQPLAEFERLIDQELVHKAR